MLKDRPVFMSVAFSGDRVMLGTGIKTDFNAWDPGLQRMKNSYPGSLTSNAWLDTLEDIARKTWETLRNDAERPDGERFRSTFLEHKPRHSEGFFDLFFHFLETGMERWSTATYMKVRTIYKHLREFEETRGRKLAFRDINGDFADEFGKFYASKGNSRSTTCKALEIIVWFLNWTTGQGFNTDLEYKKLYRAFPKEDRRSELPVYLKIEELALLGSRNCESRKLERVRDLFCFMCYTGLRYTELQSLKKGDVEESEVRIREKAGRVRRVPLNVHAREILRSYEHKYYRDNTAFPAMSIITLNKYLKMLGKQAGLNRMVSRSAAAGGKVPLYECLTAGIAVQTFIANAIALDTPAAVIARFTGLRNDSRVGRIQQELANREIKKWDLQ
jgi:integrase